MRPLISIITPVYNKEKYLAECIESVLAQADPDWELLLIDDGSTDDSGRICDRYAKVDERIRVVHQKNTGQFASRMAGIQIAEGEYCTGLDSDDRLTKDCISKIKKSLEEGSYDILCWNIMYISEQGEEISRTSMDCYGTYNGMDFLEIVGRSSNYSFCNKLIRTTLLREGFYGVVPHEIRQGEDGIQICAAICMADTIYVMDEALYEYRQVFNSMSYIYNGDKLVQYLDAIRCILAIISHYGLLTPELEKIECGGIIPAFGHTLIKSYMENKITEQEKETIRNHPVYERMRRVENRNFGSTETVIFLKLFRWRVEWMLRVLCKWKRRETARR